MKLLEPRSRFGLGWIESVVLAGFCAVLAVTIPFHEPWADEAQAWLLARDCSLSHLLFYQLHYEGTPGLWHVLLWIATRLHLPYISMNCISGGLIAAAIYVFLKYSPFPLLFRVLVPFTFFFQYQYSVIARNYALFPLSVFLLCLLYTQKKPHLLWFAITAGLTANGSMHGWFFALGISIAYLIKLMRLSRKDPGQVLSRRSLMPSGAVLCSLMLFGFYTALPAPDVHFFIAGEGAIDHSIKIRSILTGIPEPATAMASDNYPKERLEQQAAEPVKSMETPHSLSGRLYKAIKPRSMITAAFAAYPYATNRPLGWLFLAATLAFIFTYGHLEDLLPFVTLMAAMVLIHSQDHHAGMLLVALLGSLWLTWDKQTLVGAKLGILQIGYAALFTTILLLQIGWSVHAVRADIRGAYDPAKITATFLKQHAAGKTVISYYYEPTADEPYFQNNIFANRQRSYFFWSLGGQTSWATSPEAVLALHPKYIVLSKTFYGPDVLDFNSMTGKLAQSDEAPPEIWVRRHFQQTHEFCGQHFMRSGYTVRDCQLIFEPFNSEVVPKLP